MPVNRQKPKKAAAKKRAPAPKKPGRPRAKTRAAKQARAVKIAAQVIAGASTAEIAAANGLSKSQALRVLQSAEVQQLLVVLVNGHVGLISSLLERSLGVIGDALQADRPSMTTKAGDVVEGGPDHFARLTAVARLIKLLTAGRPVPKAAEVPPARNTLAQLEADLGISGGASYGSQEPVC